MGKKKEKKRQLNEAANNSPKKKRLEELQLPQIDDDYKDVEKWKEILQSGLKDIKPFPHWQLKNFIKNSENVVEEIEDELQNFDGWHRKENDLYSLWQTDDFKALEADQTPSLCKFREFFYGPVKKWLQEVSGVELLDQVDMNGSLYSHTDNLLPHNDLIDTRRFAFVYYLVPFMWEETNGGELCLYNSDENDQPTDIAVELKPHRNSLLIFEVTHKSWHRVKEILTREDPRLSINGWFHSSRRLEAKSAPPAEISRFSQIDGEGDLSSWIDKRYLTDKSVKGQLAETFSDTSEIQLKNFFTDRGRKLLEELKRLDFQERGPPNKRHSRCGDLQSGGAEFQGLDRLLKSKPMATFLSEITGCELNDCRVSLSLSRLQTGSYTVLGDEDHELADKDGFILETHLFWADQEWPEKSGGDTIYVSKGDEEPLITIHPDPFSANIVLREPEVLPFLKYTNSLTQGSFYQVTLTYYNVPIERENEDEEEEQEENEEIEE